MSYRNGITVIDKGVSSPRLSEAPYGIVGIIGCAPTTYGKNKITVVRSASDAALFGAEVPEYNIPEALNILLKDYKVSPVLVINVFDPLVHKTAVVNENVLERPTTGSNAFKFKSAHAPIDGTVVLTSVSGTVTLVRGVDYQYDVFGNFTILNKAVFTWNYPLKLNYHRFNGGLVTSSDIVGTEVAGVRTGLQLFREAAAKVGLSPDIIVATRYSHHAAVRNELLSLSEDLDAVHYVSSPFGASKTAILDGRNNDSIGFDAYEESRDYIYPWLGRLNPFTGNTQSKLVPGDIHLAALRAYVDTNYGIHYSVNGFEFKNVTSTEYALSSSGLGNDIDALNGVGVYTVKREAGTGFVCMGTRNSSFPEEEGIASFSTSYRIKKFVTKTLKGILDNVLPRPNINPAGIDLVLTLGQTFLDSLVARQVLLPGSVISFNMSDNNIADLEDGKIVFEVSMGYSPTAENIVFNLVYNSTLLTQALS